MEILHNQSRTESQQFRWKQPTMPQVLWPKLWLVAAICLGPARSVISADYQQTVAPFLKRHCLACHGEKPRENTFSFSNVGHDFKRSKQTGAWRKVLEKLQLGEMPPEDQPQPDSKSRERVIAWITSELQKNGIKTSMPSRMFDPKFGNRVKHELLFNTASASKPAASPPRIWRLNPYAYSDIAYDLTRRNEFAQPFAFEAGDGIKDYSARYSVDEPTSDLLIRNAMAIASHQMYHTVERDGRLKGGWRSLKEALAILDPKSKSPSKEQIEKLIQRQYHAVLQRDPNDEELSRFVAFAAKNIHESGRRIGIQTTLAALLLLPETVFRLELGAGPADQHGRVMLSPREIAYAIAYALTDDRPDGRLLSAFAPSTNTKGKNGLATKQPPWPDATTVRQIIRVEIARLLHDPKKKTPRVLRFFHEYFGYHNAPEVFKDKADFGSVNAKILVFDTDQLVLHILKKDQNVLYELLTTNKSFVNFRVDRKKGPIKAHDKDHMEACYNVASDKWSKKQPMELPQNERAGILTQPSWLIAHSANTETHPIFRGKWVRERLLGGVIPDLPITVDAQLPEAPHRTLRQRMEVTNQEYCWNCHQKMNPLGLSFEMFDHLGRVRKTESVLDVLATKKNVDKKGKHLGDVLREVPLNASGSIDNSGDSELDTEVKNAIEMIHRLAKSERVQQIFIRYAFRYWMGRNETLSDASTLIAANKAYNESGGSMEALITSLLTSDSFLYRR